MKNILKRQASPQAGGFNRDNYHQIFMTWMYLLAHYMISHLLVNKNDSSLVPCFLLPWFFSVYDVFGTGGRDILTGINR